MKFEVINDKGMAVMSCADVSCIPDDSQLSSMIKAGYKFKIDEKIVTVKKIKNYVNSFTL